MRTYEYDPATQAPSAFVCPDYAASDGPRPVLEGSCHGVGSLELTDGRAEFACRREDCALIGRLASSAAMEGGH